MLWKQVHVDTLAEFARQCTLRRGVIGTLIETPKANTLAELLLTGSLILDQPKHQHTSSALRASLFLLLLLGGSVHADHQSMISMVRLESQLLLWLHTVLLQPVHL